MTSGEKKAIDLLARMKYRHQDTFFLIHIEAQSYSQCIFTKRMFEYFARLHENYDLPVYPIVIFSFDEPKRPELCNYSVIPTLNVLQFNFAAIELNQLSWRDYLTQRNPVAAALMSKMNIAPSERPRVKAECLRLLLTLQLDPARMQLISGFVDTYLQLNAQETEAFQTTIDTMGLTDDRQQGYMEIVTSWVIEKAEKIAMKLLRKEMTLEDIAEATELTIERLRELQTKLQKGN